MNATTHQSGEFSLPRNGAVEISPFRARPPWWGGDLQTLRNLLNLKRQPLPDGPGQRVHLRLAGEDRLAASLHGMDHIGKRPLVVLLHGLTGCEDSSYIRASTLHFQGLGYPVLRLNLRGAGPSRESSQGFYHAGLSADLRQALHYLASESRSLGSAGFLLVGYSLGGNLVLKYLAEGEGIGGVHAAATVSAPIDLKVAQEALMRRRNWAYHRYFLDRLRRDSLAPSLGLNPADRNRVRQLRSVYEFDDQITAPYHGFDGAEDYYARASAKPLLAEIKIPSMLISAADDPLIPIDSYRSIDWRQYRLLVACQPAGGGHVGFHAVGNKTAWHNRRIAAFFDEVLPA